MDPEWRDVIDLLPDRGADTVTKAHPGAEAFSRGRPSTDSQAATEGAPGAAQVADRWHLLKNLLEAVERLFERYSSVVAEAVTGVLPPPEQAIDAGATEQAVGSSSRAGPAITTTELPRRGAHPT